MNLTKEQITARNSILMVIEGTLFWAGLSFLEGNTVISVFMDSMTGSNAMAGLAATLKSVMFIIGQFIAGTFIHKIRVQSKFMRIMSLISRPIILIMIPFLLSGLSGRAAAFLFLFLYSCMFLTDGFVGLCWTEISVRTLPVQRRGEVVALQQTFSGLIGLLAGFIIRTTFGSSLSTTHQFALIFAFSGAMMMLDLVVLFLLKDVPHPSTPDRPVLRLKRYAETMVPLVSHNKSARHIFYARALFLITLMSAPINILFGKHVGGLSENQINWLVFMPVIGQILAGLLWSYVSRRLGYPFMMLISEILGAVSALLGFVCLVFVRFGLPVIIPLGLSMVLIALNTSAWLGYQNHMVVIVPEDKRALYVVLANVLMAPMSLATYYAGVISERWGYAPVYAIMLLAGSAGALLVYRSFFSSRSKLPAEHRHEPLI